MDEREEKALSIGGTHPGSTDTGLGDVDSMGGGLAVPPDDMLENSDALGDTGSLDDATMPGEPATGNVGTSLEEETNGVDRGGSTEGNAEPQANASDKDTEPNGDAPTGGLSSSGTIGGVPSGAAENGSGGPGL